MKQPLALVFYERLLPGSQLVNRLQDLGYRVQTVHAAEALLAAAEKEKPLLVFADLACAQAKVSEVIAQLKQNPATSHLPVIAFAPESRMELQVAARTAGAVVTIESVLLGQLPQLLDQALQLE